MAAMAELEVERTRGGGDVDSKSSCSRGSFIQPSSLLCPDPDPLQEMVGEVTISHFTQVLLGRTCLASGWFPGLSALLFLLLELLSGPSSSPD